MDKITGLCKFFTYWQKRFIIVYPDKELSSCNSKVASQIQHNSIVRFFRNFIEKFLLIMSLIIYLLKKNIPFK